MRRSEPFKQGSETVDPGGQLKVYCTGGLRLRSALGDQLVYKAASESSRIEFTRQGRVAALRAFTSSLEVTVPRGLELVTATTLGGDFDCGGIEGSLVLEAAGRIAIGHVGGSLEVRSRGGVTGLGSVAGKVVVVSAGGLISADSLHGEAILQTGGGDISVGRAVGAVRAHTGGGGIDIARADGPVTASNSGGPIVVGGAAGVNCESASGSIKLAGIAGALQASTGSGSIVAQLLSGAPARDSFLSTNHGDITVFIPSNLRISIRAQCEGTGNIRRIVSEFPDLQGRSLGAAVLAEGALNGGGALLRLTGSGGTIFIRKRK